MRTRTTSYSDPVTPLGLTGYGGSGTCTTPITTNLRNTGYDEINPSGSVAYEWSKVMHDIVTPGYYRRSAAGEIINNPYDYTLTEWHRGIFSWYVSQFEGLTVTCSGKPTFVINSGARRMGSRGVNNVFGYPQVFLSAPALDVEAAKNLAVTQANSKIGEQTAQGLVILAEGEKTIKSFIDITKRLIRIGRALRKWDVGYLSRQLSGKELANRWMEGRYAIRPVVYDMVDCVKAWNKKRFTKPYRQTYRGGYDTQGTVTQDLEYTSNVGLLKIPARKVSQRIISARSGVLTAVDEITEASIWGLDQPFTAMWELVPFSFCVDWFLNVGQTIAAWTPKWGVRSLASWVTVKDIVSQSIFMAGAPYSTYTSPRVIYEDIVQVSGGFVTKVTTTVNRYANPNLPILPSFNIRLDGAKLIDLAIWAKRFFRR